MSPANAKNPLSVLLIEDNTDQRELLAILLQRDGYHVTTAENGAEGLEKLAKKPAQIVLSDIMMPKMDGFELIRRIRSNADFKNIYLIFITARVLEGERVQGLDLGADDYILKPFSPSELLARIRVGARVVQYQQHLEYQALRDPLTGLFNRRAFEDRIEEEFERTTRYHHPLSLFILDIDNFKVINDTHGHHLGDNVLQKIAELLRSKTRRSDLPCRYGGEEFILMLPETKMESALRVGNKIRSEIKKCTFGTSTGAFSVTVSGGISSTSKKKYSSWSEMLRDADQALYLAKNRGKDRVEILAK
jgi:diguanylate cyclase (GGDEF)-like protein